MPAGSCFFFNNGVEHEVWNESQTESRLTLIIDIHGGTSAAGKG